MRKADIYVNEIKAGILTQSNNEHYDFEYLPEYQGPPVSLTLPITQQAYSFNEFPAFLDGLLPEGVMLQALLRKAKLDRQDYFGQILIVGNDLVGALTVKEQQHD